jgi:pimeloyl-ACP methyl ester carboxylesterase
LTPGAPIELWHEVAGAGPPVLLIHAGICDADMWEPQWRTFPPRHRTVRCDLRGFGRTPIPAEAFSNAADVVALVERLDLGPVALVGVSLGGRVALEVAIARPELVSGLVVVGAPLPGHEWSDTVRAFSAAEDEALERSDLDAAVEANLRMWVDGPHREPGEADPEVRRQVAGMQRRAFELQLPVLEEADDEPLVADLSGRLGEISAPTLVAVGALDAEDMLEIAALIAERVPDARTAAIAEAAHVPSLERPAEFDRLVLGFLGELNPTS